MRSAPYVQANSVAIYPIPAMLRDLCVAGVLSSVPATLTLYPGTLLRDFISCANAGPFSMPSESPKMAKTMSSTAGASLTPRLFCNSFSKSSLLSGRSI